MYIAKTSLAGLAIALFVFVGAAPPARATIVQQEDTHLAIMTDRQQPAAGATVDIVSTDGTFKAEGYTDLGGNICVVGRDNPDIAPGRHECIYLPDGDYRLFVNADEPIRFSVRNGNIDIPPPPRKSRPGLIAGAALVVAAGLAGGGGGSSGSAEPDEPGETLSMNVTPPMLEGEFEFGVSTCPTVIGELTVTNTGDVDARIAANPVEGISVTGQGQLLAPGDSGTLTVLYNCLVISAIAGVVQITLTSEDSTASATANIEIVVDFL